MLLPGIYQLKKKEYLKGTLLAGGFLLLAGGALWKNLEGYGFYDKYKAATDRDSVVYYRKRTEECMRTRNYLAMAAAGLWLLHVLDVKFSAKKKTRIRGKIEKNSASISISYSF